MRSLGVILLVISLVWFLQTLGYVDASIWNVIWPLILFYFGFVMVAKSCDKECMMCHMDARHQIIKKEIIEKKKPVEKKKVVAKKKK